MRGYIVLLVMGFLLISCGGVNNNISFSMQQGSCVGQNFAPYCMAVTIQNNAGGQNWISSTNFPISNMSLTLSGASNIQSPNTNKSTMDPNNCMSSTIAPGKNCTFYLKLSGESYAVTNFEPITGTLNYTTNNNLFGGGGASGSQQFTIYEVTNLYILQNSGVQQANLFQYNYLNNKANLYNVGVIESVDTVQSMNTDNTSFGYLFVGGANGIYYYGNKAISSSISGGAITSGASNIIQQGSTLFMTGMQNNYGVWKFGLSNESWISNLPVYTASVLFTSNIGTLSPASALYFANMGTVYVCALPGVTSSACQLEANSMATILNPIVSLGFLAISNINYAPLYTGLYVANATTGLFLESGSTYSANNRWLPINLSNGQPLVGITSMITYANNLYIGDSTGSLWIINSNTPLQISPYVSKPLGFAINKMMVDSFTNILYLTAGGNLYSCPLKQNSCTLTSLGQIGGATVVGMGIASMLTNSLNN